MYDNEILYILEHIRKEDKTELIALFGEDWKTTTLAVLRNGKVRILYGYNYRGQYVPVAMGGIEACLEMLPSYACVWLITTKYIGKNKKRLLKVLKEEFELAESKYDFLYNFLHKSNKKAKNWLKKFGFYFEDEGKEYSDKNFEFFYKFTNGKDKQCV